MPFRATLPGWHRVRVELDPNGQMHAAVTHEGSMLKAPERPDIKRDIHLFWLDPEDEPERRTAARDLARYFILGWTKTESAIARELHERTDDVYPELSQIGLEHEMLLKRLVRSRSVSTRTSGTNSRDAATSRCGYWAGPRREPARRTRTMRADTVVPRVETGDRSAGSTDPCPPRATAETAKPIRIVGSRSRADGYKPDKPKSWRSSRREPDTSSRR